MLNYYDSFDCQIQSDEQSSKYEERERVLEELKPYAVLLYKNGYYSANYMVYNVPIEWSDDDLINFCDSSNFGGTVIRDTHNQKAQVNVYTD